MENIKYKERKESKMNGENKKSKENKKREENKKNIIISVFAVIVLIGVFFNI